MEDFLPFLFFLLWIGLSIFNGSKKRKNRNRQNLPQSPILGDIDDLNNLPNEPQTVQTEKTQQNKQTNTLDYMMSAPKQQDDERIYREPEIYREPVQVEKQSEISHSTMSASSTDRKIVDDVEQFLRRYQDYTERVNANKTAVVSNKDYIQQGEITSDKSRKLQINIEKQQIIQAITYAQVLEPPKSLQYLKRFGIRRIMHKD